MNNIAIWCCCEEECPLSSNSCETSCGDDTPLQYTATPVAWPTLPSCMPYDEEPGGSDNRDTGLFWDTGEPGTGSGSEIVLTQINAGSLRCDFRLVAFDLSDIIEGVYDAGTDCLVADSSSAQTMHIRIRTIDNTTVAMWIELASAVGEDYVIFYAEYTKTSAVCVGEQWTFTNEIVEADTGSLYFGAGLPGGGLVAGGYGGSFTVVCGDQTA